MIKKIVGIILIFSTVVFAGSITFRISIDTVNTNFTQANANIYLENIGNEDANNVVLSIFSPDIVSSSKNLGKISVRKRTNLTLPIEMQKNKTGRYFYALIVEYEDANGYPFSVVAPGKINLREETSSDVLCSVPEVNLAKKESIELKVKNTGNLGKKTSVSIFSPREIKIPFSKEIELGPGEEVNFQVPVENLNALKNSIYSYFCLVEYADQRHYSNVAKNIIKIRDEKPIEIPVYLFISLIVLILLMVVLKVKK